MNLYFWWCLWWWGFTELSVGVLGASSTNELEGLDDSGSLFLFLGGDPPSLYPLVGEAVGRLLLSYIIEGLLYRGEAVGRLLLSYIIEGLLYRGGCRRLLLYVLQEG